MKQLLIFCVESQDAHHDSDGLYIKQALNHFYQFDQHKTILRFIYMNGKYNYAKRQIQVQLKKFMDQLAAEDQAYVFYVCDKDEELPSDFRHASQIQAYCQQKGYFLIWMNRNIEEVFWGRKVENGNKVKEAIRFKTSGRIQSLPESVFMNENAQRRTTSNFLLVLDPWLKRKN
ncbi:hypothetical protein [Holdemania massiliensis]|uniref:hypothetical protein n=1 Tax=Holdemania massiliensis TaxID=1468449 RepID=UPI00031E7684|nr:hypothetical protein [Holdemania massiliensis]